MHGFVSTYTMKLDAKGRVSVPAPFRQILAADGFEGLYCFPAPDMAALDAGGNRLLSTIEARLEGLQPYSEAHDLLSTAFYGVSEILKIDQDGRVGLTETLKAYAGISGQVTFVGQAYKFQIWAPERFADYLAEARAKARAVLRGGAPAGSAQA
ncbi:MAG: division/cell wall cluster transcriptional repressor MraZ [Hyphomicrobiales bacterium]